MLDLRQLGWVQDGQRTIDLTVGHHRGFWKKWEPLGLYTNDKDPNVQADYHHDFTDLPTTWTDYWDTTIFDPDYRLGGTRDRGEFDIRYGTTGDSKEPHQVKHHIQKGLQEAWRVTRPGGLLMLKGQAQQARNQYNDSRQWAHQALNWFDIIPRGELLVANNYQAGKQATPRNNRSYLYVWQKHDNPPTHYIQQNGPTTQLICRHTGTCTEKPAWPTRTYNPKTIHNYTGPGPWPTRLNKTTGQYTFPRTPPTNPTP